MQSKDYSLLTLKCLIILMSFHSLFAAVESSISVPSGDFSFLLLQNSQSKLQILLW